jgi:cytochrome P450
LAKLQLSEFFTALLQRFERVDVVESPSFTPGLIFRSVNGLKVRFTQRAAT